MSVSLVGIVNTALDHIGQSPITSLSEANPVAEKARRLLPGTLNFVLRAHLWKFAQKRVALAKLKATPAFGYQAQFQLPTDFIRLVKCEPDVPFTVEGRKILCDSPRLAIVYVGHCADPSLFDDAFREALELKLAANMAYGSTASGGLAESLNTRYLAAVREARGYDAREGEGQKFPASAWAAAKLGR
ncbi:hypothetical protein FACS1894206_10270 [Deltaproteobacteria bacterium]|nr:hypothetical protein FACS1894206_10270 [Deltaproteobacteria bacterium]